MDKFAQKCLAKGCSQTTDQPGIGFFDFPSENRELIRAWNKALGFRANCKHILNPKVCEQHFRSDEINRETNPIMLTKPDVVPSVDVIPTPSNEDPKDNVEGSSQDSDYCRLCAKVERLPLKDSLANLMKCSDTAKLLGICLESSREYDNLPSGVCVACAHMIKFWIKFIRTCNNAQGKLIKLFNESECMTKYYDGEKDIKPNSKEDVTTIKKEEEEAGELPTDYLEMGLGKDENTQEVRYIIDEETKFDDNVQSNLENLENPPTDMDVKEEPYEKDYESDLDMPHDFDASSASDSDTNEEYSDEYDLGEEHMKKLNKDIIVKFEAHQDDYAAAEKPKKKRGRPRKNEQRPSKGSGKSKEKRDKSTDDKPASLSKQVCQICGKILSSSATFNVHMMTHTQQKDIVCPICDRRFYVKQQLKIHIESIHEKKDFVCNICGLKCRWRKSLRRHMLLHDDNPYKHKCTYCDKAFARPNQLRYHVMKHTGDRVYCEICGADYRFNYMLTQHKIRKHGIVVEGVQLYKQSSRKKKSEGSDQSTTRKNRVAQQVEAQLELPVVQTHASMASVIQQLALPEEHDRTHHIEPSVSAITSPVTTTSYASPEPVSHFQGHAQAQHIALQQSHVQQHHQPTSPINGFNATSLSMSMQSGLIGFTSNSGQ